ncbi:MAG TPA: serine/threonine-protein kinase, partial [Gemmatimonadaceae bacterium]|nr:serine/threonine-protein kinase [Gemmatimonadaceae bacterium]
VCRNRRLAMGVLGVRIQNVLSERYVIERELGHGGMAVVFLAHDVRHDRPVAIKVFRSDIGDSNGAARFQREIRLLARLQHPHILPLYDSGTTGETSYFVSPFVAGETLRERLKREHQLPVAEAVRLATEVADALDFAHTHDVVHRDIKPENILLHDGHAVVADFGIARAMRRTVGEWATAAGMTVGSPAYMSPEQATGDHEIDGRTDIYSLACVLYEMLASHPPFTGRAAHLIIAARMTGDARPIRELRPEVPAPLDEALAKALERDARNRFASAGEFYTALTHAMLPPPAPERPARRWPFGGR